MKMRRLHFWREHQGLLEDLAHPCAQVGRRAQEPTAYDDALGVDDDGYVGGPNRNLAEDVLHQRSGLVVVAASFGELLHGQWRAELLAGSLWDCAPTDEFLAFCRKMIIDEKLVIGRQATDDSQTGRITRERFALQIRQLEDLGILPKGRLTVDQVMTTAFLP